MPEKKVARSKTQDEEVKKRERPRVSRQQHKHHEHHSKSPQQQQERPKNKNVQKKKKRNKDDDDKRQLTAVITFPGWSADTHVVDTVPVALFRIVRKAVVRTWQLGAVLSQPSWVALALFSLFVAQSVSVARTIVARTRR